jgi:alkyl hydroperoxide reductase subunit AhpF
MLNVPGEKKFLGHGVTYCATCDGPLFRNQDVVVVGCGNSGLQEGRFLLGITRSVTFVEFLPHITADKVLADKIRDDPNARFLLNHQVVSINGTDRVDAIIVKDRGTNAERSIPATGVFIYAGLLPNTHFLKGFIDMDEAGFIITNEFFETSVIGVYAAGDARVKQVRQVVVACAEGAIAAINAYEYMKNQ